LEARQPKGKSQAKEEQEEEEEEEEVMIPTKLS
jgi:hypothetical protein